MENDQPVEGEVIEGEGHVQGRALEKLPDEAVAVPSNLFKTDDPGEVVKRAQATADALKPVIERENMMQPIGNKLHPKIEGLQTLGTMLGVTAVNAWTKETDTGWEARAVVQTLDGRIIGAAESQCDRTEDRWKDSDPYAIRSMAQTRAASKALASVLRFVLVLAGFSGTPAEEMHGVKGGGQRQMTGEATGPQKGRITRELKEKFKVEHHEKIRAAYKADTKAGASELIEALQGDGRAVAAKAGLGGDVPDDGDQPDPADDYPG